MITAPALPNRPRPATRGAGASPPLAGVAVALLALLGCDAAPGAAPDHPAPATLQLEVGTAPLGTRDFATFRPLSDGDRVEVELGAQGAFMAVAAFRVRGLPPGRMAIAASLDTPDGPIAAASLHGQRWVSHAGWGYYFDLLLLVEGLHVLGREAALTLRVTGEHGGTIEVTREVIVGDPLYTPPVCRPPGLDATSIRPRCLGEPDPLAVVADDVGPLAGLSADARDEVLAIAGHADGRIRLWRWDGLVGEELGSWPTSGVVGGLAAAALPDGVGAAWSDAQGAWFARGGEEPVALGEGGELRAARTAGGALRVLVSGGEELGLMHLDAEGRATGHHYVNRARVVGTPGLHVEGRTLFIVYDAVEPTRPFFLQTSDLAASQCSIPAPLGRGAGDDGRVVASTVAHGVAVFAVEVPARDGCPRQSRLVGTSRLSDGFEAESAWRFGSSVRLLPAGSLAAAVTLLPEGNGWAAVSQTIDVTAGRLGAASVGFVQERATPAPPPDAWDAAPYLGRTVVVWNEGGRVLLQGLCL